MQSRPDERRRYARVPFDGPVRAEQIQQSTWNRNHIWNLVPADLSEGGVRLSSSELFPVESRLLLELDTELGEDPIRAHGRVVWVAQVPFQDQWQVGVAFFDVTESRRSRLRAIVNAQQAANN